MKYLAMRLARQSVKRTKPAISATGMTGFAQAARASSAPELHERFALA
jgi:hypothetical protein